MAFDTVKTFCATLVQQRNELGERVTAWLQSHREIRIADIIVTQSSDAAYHCLTVTVFYLRSGGDA